MRHDEVLLMIILLQIGNSSVRSLQDRGQSRSATQLHGDISLPLLSLTSPLGYKAGATAILL